MKTEKSQTNHERLGILIIFVIDKVNHERDKENVIKNEGVPTDSKKYDAVDIQLQL